MTYKRFSINLQLDFSVSCNGEAPDWLLDTTEMKRLMERDTWDEGRYDLHSELIAEGMRQKLLGCLGRAINDKMFAMFGHVSVQTSETSTQNLGSIRAQDLWIELFPTIHVDLPIYNVTVSEVA